MNKHYAPALVAIDEGFGPFPCQILTDYRWNGFACPRFTYEVALQVAVASNALADKYGDDTASRFVVVDDAAVIMQLDPSYDPDEPPHVTVYTADDDGMYPIGSHAWCWQEVEA